MIPEPLTRIGHGLFGFVSTMSVLVHPILPALSAVLFVIYELDESFHLCDEAYADIREYLYGVVAALVVLLAREVML
jgi:hypothetical protein